MYKKALLRIFLLIVSASVSYSQIVPQDNIYAQIKKIQFVLSTMSKNYVEDVDNNKIVEKAIRAMLAELDPHSVYIPAENMKEVKEEFQGNFEGIGVEFNIIEDTITIVSALSGGPSEALGIISNDKIINIDGKSAVGLTMADVPKRLRGPRGTKVVIDIKRASEKDMLQFEIIRDKIPIYSVDASYIIEGTDIGYVSINRFMATTYIEMIDSLKILESKGMKKLIIDLRTNPGGYMDQSYLMADEFIKEGNTIVFTKGRKPEFDDIVKSTANGKYEKTPLIVLVDGGSASASEIFSGAIQDLDRGIIIGETSFGKGLVQRQYELDDGSAFRLTIARYYTPSGRCIQRSYEDKSKYYDVSERMENIEGSNLDHELDKIKKNSTGDSLPPMYKTKMGRNVLGSGGITPDYFVKYDTITVLSRQIRSKNLFTIYSLAYLEKNRTELTKKYKSNFSEYLKNFNLSDAEMLEFKEFAVSKGITWNDEQFKIDETYLKTALKSLIARSMWGNNEERAIFNLISKHVNKAIELFPEAIKFAGLK